MGNNSEVGIINNNEHLLTMVVRVEAQTLLAPMKGIPQIVSDLVRQVITCIFGGFFQYIQSALTMLVGLRRLSHYY